MIKKLIVINQTRPVSPCVVAELRPDFWGKFKGLMFRKVISPETSLVLDQTHDSRLDSSIHMLFMNFDIAVIWVNSALRVVDTRLAKKWALAYLPKTAARYILEAPVEALSHYQIGDQLEFRYE